MMSADEKGVVRRKQFISSMRIVTPFGRKVNTVSLNSIDAVRTKMATDLATKLEAYLQKKEIAQLRKDAITILRPGMEQALGETREPANDVTLWAQSFGVASLYKSCLAAMAMGNDPCPRTSIRDWDYENIKWRLFGIGWNGRAFLQRGRKAADILRRREIINEARNQIQHLLEVTYPVGNLFYADLNGAFFTFPGVDQAMADSFIDQVAQQLADIVRRTSDNELWPFFTLSRPRRTLTAIAREIQMRDRLAATPCVAALLSIENDAATSQSTRTERLVVQAPGLPLPGGAEQDVCPVCRFRSKPLKDETCSLCHNRRRGRQQKWFKEIEGRTIWADEIADDGNRIALLTLRFDLSPWLSGEWFSTILTQTFDDWSKSQRCGTALKRLKEFIAKNQIPSPNATAPAELARAISRWIVANSTRTECKPALESFMEDGQVSDARQVLSEIADLYGTANEETVLSNFFTQNPSPGRLIRTWKAAEDFIQSLVDRIGDEVFSERPQRLWFQIETEIAEIESGETYRIVVPGMTGGPLVVLALSRKEFLTIDCLQKFRLQEDKKCSDSDAVKKALETGGVESWRVEATGSVTGKPSAVKSVRANGQYLPFAVLSDSPAFAQILLPANRIPNVLKTFLKLEDEHFGAVRGKLALHIGVLVANRKFPLYALVEAGQRILNHSGLDKGFEQAPWFGLERHNEFFRYYATEESQAGLHPITTLSLLGARQQYWLTSGYFDFDFLGGTVDRHRLQYVTASPPLRPSIAYGWLHLRPISIARLRKIFDMWGLLRQLKLGPTQRHEIEAALSSKLEQWRAIGSGAQDAFQRFAQAVLANSFNSCKTLREEDRQLLQGAAADGLLLDTIQFFDHVVKGDFIL